MYERKETQPPALVIKNATFITSAARADQFITPDKPMIAVCGKSNVGKSDLGGNTTVRGGTGFKGSNAPRPANAPNVTHTGKNGGTTVNQGVTNSGQQGAVHENVQNKGATQRPPIPRGTAGAHPQGVNPMNSVVNGGNTNVGKSNVGKSNVGKSNVGKSNSGVSQNTTTVKGGSPIVPPPVVSGGKTVVDTDVVHSRSDVKGTTQKGGNVSGGSVHSTQIGGNGGGVNIGGNTQIHSEHSGSERFTDRSSERFHDSHTRGHTQTNTRQETTERKVNHEYKHGRYNPAAANKKVKKTYYQKDNSAGVRSNNNPHVKRGENNRTKHKR